MLIALGIIAYLAVGVIFYSALVWLSGASSLHDESNCARVAIFWPLSAPLVLAVAAFVVLSGVVTKLSEYLTTWQERPGVGAKPDPGGIDEEYP